MRPYSILLLTIFSLACKKSATIDYQTAYKLSPTDTMRMVANGDTIETYSVDYIGLIGAQLPEFTARTLDDKEIDHTYFAGKVSVINFWFEGCHSCELEMPVFNRLVEKYKNQDVNFLAIGRNSPDDIKDFLIRSPFNFDHIGYGEPIIVDTFKSVWGYPITFVADKDRKIVLVSRGLGDTTKVTDAQMAFVQAIDDALADK